MDQKIRIIGISTSPKYHGNTSTLVRQILKGAQSKGAEIKEFHLPEYDISFCQGCFTCMKKGSCIINDDFESLKEEMINTDGIIIGAPTYGLAPNAMMKNFLDRLGMFSVYTSLLKDTYIIGVSSCGRFGAKKTAKRLTGIVDGIWGSGKKTGILAAKVGFQSVQDNPRILEKAEKLGERIVKDISLQKSYWYKELFGKFISRVAMRPAMKKNILQHKNSEMKGVYEYLKSKDILK